MFRDDFVVRRVGHRLADAENQSHDEHESEAVEEAGRQRCERPDKQAESEEPVHIEFVYQPAGYDLEWCVGPKESRQQDAELRRREMKIFF